MARRKMSTKTGTTPTGKSRIVEAVGTAAGGESRGSNWSAAEMEEVLAKATEEAQAKGLSDDKVREYKLKAREEFKRSRNASKKGSDE